MEIDLTGQIGICRHGTTTIAKLIEWDTRSTCHHVVVAISNTECVSAEPGGVVIHPISYYHNLTFSRFDLSDDEKSSIVAAANASLKLPYNYAIYLPLFLSRVTNVPVPTPIAEWLGERRNVDCSQLADDIYKAAGKRLFIKKPSDIVTPGDFERAFAAAGFLDAPKYQIAA